ncbi:MAG: SDR family NAD(P)-dependent oxidoreductase [Planctomycetota bacterium]
MMTLELRVREARSSRVRRVLARVTMGQVLLGRVLVITGASSGIGAATAVAAAKAGMDVVANARRAERLEELATRVRALGREAKIVAGDVAEGGMSARLLDAAVTRFGRFDVVFANAGYGFKKPSHELSEAELRRLFDVNFFAAVNLLCEAARRLLAARSPGHLLMCSSALSKFTLKNYAAYSATKAAQNHFCRAMRMELRHRGIEVSSVHPVTTATEFFAHAAEHEGEDPVRAAGSAPRWMVQSPERVAAAIVRCLRRPKPEVWTSPGVRLLAGLVTAFPRLLDLVGQRA